MPQSTRLPLQIRVLIGLALFLAYMTILTGKAISQEPNASIKTDQVVPLPEPKPQKKLRRPLYRDFETLMRDYRVFEERQRWKYSEPKPIDPTGRLQRVPGLYPWII